MMLRFLRPVFFAGYHNWNLDRPVFLSCVPERGLSLLRFAIRWTEEGTRHDNFTM